MTVPSTETTATNTCARPLRIARIQAVHRAELEELDVAIGGFAPGDLDRRLHWLGGV